ncbi:MAG TPA: hypothetical protein VF799_03430 [Geobacteraceae bacterium]
MKTCELTLLKRALFLPLVLALSFCLLFLGMRVPNVHKDQRPKLQYRAEIESPVKASQAGIEKQAQAFDFCVRAGLTEPAALHFFPCQPEQLNRNSIVISAISARASPVPRV